MLRSKDGGGAPACVGWLGLFAAVGIVACLDAPRMVPLEERGESDVGVAVGDDAGLAVPSQVATAEDPSTPSDSSPSTSPPAPSEDASTPPSPPDPSPPPATCPAASTGVCCGAIRCLDCGKGAGECKACEQTCAPGNFCCHKGGPTRCVPTATCK